MSRTAPGAVLLQACALLVLTATAPAQDGSKVRGLLDKAVNGSPVVRPQAARRLVNLGAESVPVLREACGEGPRDLARLGSAVVEILAEFEDADLRQRLWEALADRDFPWRPAAARSLASKVRVDEEKAFLELSGDALATVRVAALEAMRRADWRRASPTVRKLLEDPDDRVRRAAAAMLDQWGDPRTLTWLLEDLRRDDCFFDNTTGKTARYDAIRRLEPRLGGRFGYDPRLAPEAEANVAALATLESKVKELCGGRLARLPEVAKAGTDRPGDLFGLELRSCRRGERYLRWNQADVLKVGLGNAREVALPPGTVTALVSHIDALLTTLDTQVFGELGCDSEQFHVRGDNGRARVFKVSKGPDAVEGLRPVALTQVLEMLVETIPAEEQELRQDVHEILAVLGGPLQN